MFSKLFSYNKNVKLYYVILQYYIKKMSFLLNNYYWVFKKCIVWYSESSLIAHVLSSSQNTCLILQSLTSRGFAAMIWCTIFQSKFHGKNRIRSMLRRQKWDCWLSYFPPRILVKIRVRTILVCILYLMKYGTFIFIRSQYNYQVIKGKLLFLSVGLII